MFDLDDTLIDRTTNFEIWTSKFLQSIGHAADSTEREWLHQIDRQGHTDRDVLFAATRTRYRLTASAEELVVDYNRQIAALARCDPPTIDALRRLRTSGWRIGIVTNGFTHQQTAKIENAGLHLLVDGWAISETVGVRKPHRKMFEHAATACGTGLDGAWVIGDDPDADIGGAAAIGLSSIWIHRGRSWPTRRHTPTHQVASIHDAAQTMGTATRSGP